MVAMRTIHRLIPSQARLFLNIHKLIDSARGASASPFEDAWRDKPHCGESIGERLAQASDNDGECNVFLQQNRT
jgi:hypothetical protein